MFRAYSLWLNLDWLVCKLTFVIHIWDLVWKLVVYSDTPLLMALDCGLALGFVGITIGVLC